MRSLNEECGVVGVWNHEEASRLVYLGLFAIQHRGQESCGIVSLSAEKEHRIHRGLGLVSEVFNEQSLTELTGQASLGHVRYSTTGKNLIANAQPLHANLLCGPLSLAHNGNLVNAKALRQKLQQSGAIFSGTTDTEIIVHLISKLLSPVGSRERDLDSGVVVEALKEALAQCEGAYSLVILTKEHLFAIRDPYGFRPLVLGTMANARGETSFVFASETCAFDLMGARYIREIEPGEIFWVDREGTHSVKIAPKAKKAHCVFELVYFARPDSIVYGDSVYEVRKNFGRVLAQESGVEADLIVPVPDSGVPAALGFSAQSGIPFELGIIRNHYVGRTFIQPSSSIRHFGVKIKLNPQQEVLKGKRVVLVDDSLVRGTTSQKIVRLVRQAGAKEVHVRIASPPTIGPCYYGVDTPQKSHLIAANQSLEEIKQFIEADSLHYLSMSGMFKAIRSTPETHFCSACFSGKYPTRLENEYSEKA